MDGSGHDNAPRAAAVVFDGGVLTVTVAGGIRIRRPDLDEDLSVAGLLRDG